MPETLKLNLHFGGGAELLFDKIKKREIELPNLKKYFPESENDKWTIRELLLWIKDNLLRERPELFLQVMISIGKVVYCVELVVHVHRQVKVENINTSVRFEYPSFINLLM